LLLLSLSAQFTENVHWAYNLRYPSTR